VSSVIVQVVLDRRYLQISGTSSDSRDGIKSPKSKINPDESRDKNDSLRSLLSYQDSESNYINACFPRSMHS